MKISVHNPLILELQTEEVFYCCRRFEPSGVAPEISWPKKSSSLVGRLLHGALWPNRLRTKDENRKVDFRAAEGHRFVALWLETGETLCFHYHSLVGFSSNISLSTYISLQFTTLCLNRIFFHLATGPGLVVLESKGVPEVFQNAAPDKAIPPVRLLCWSIETEFAIEGSGKFADIFMSPVFLRPLTSTAVVIDADDPRIQSSRFLWNILRKIYTPGL